MSIYEDKIRHALNYIQDNLDQAILWNDISKECGISEFHFHRIFSTYMGESPGDFIKRKRLERGVMTLAYSTSKLTITEVALYCGYSSQANFSKAFKGYFGVTPGEVLKGVDSKNSKIGKIKSKYGKDFNVKDLYPNPELINTIQVFFREIHMNVKIKEMAQRPVVFMQSENGYVMDSIRSTWEQLIEKASYLPMSKDSFEMFGIGHDNPQVTPQEKCRYDACILIDENLQVGDGFKTKNLPAGKYACFYYKGKNSELLQFYLDIYKTWFPNSGYEPGDHPLIERYINISKDQNVDAIELEVQFLVR